VELQVADGDRLDARDRRRDALLRLERRIARRARRRRRQARWVFPTEYERRFEAKNLHGYPPAAQTIPDAWDVFTSSPAVAGGKVYFGSGDGSVYAVDAKSGILQWKFATGDVVHSSPAVVNGIVYIGSWDSVLYALDAETGVARWTFQAGKDHAIHNQEGFQSSPAVVDGTVYVGCRDAHVYALDCRDGPQEVGLPHLEVLGDRNARGARRARLCRDLGQLRGSWRSTRRRDACASTWTSRPTSSPRRRSRETSPTSGDHNGKLYAIDAKKGTIAWEFRTEASRTDPMKVLNPDGGLRQEAFAPLFGDFQDMYADFTRFHSIGAIVSSPAVDGGVVFIGSMDGNLYALR
jgi:outer membrane protein assembly factor BamB